MHELDGSDSEDSSFMLVDPSPILIEPTKRAHPIPDTEDSSTRQRPDTDGDEERKQWRPTSQERDIELS